MLRIGIDLGGTKIEGVVLDDASAVHARRRVHTPQNDYPATLQSLVALVGDLEREAGGSALPIGMGTPGAPSRVTGLMKNCNSTCINGRPLQADLEAALGRRVRIANDADCLALSEATDGAGAGGQCVFAAILGTGVGGGIAVRGAPLSGPNAIAGEWGHNGLPRPRLDWDEVPGPACYCGRRGCIEAWLSGPAFAADHLRVTGQSLDSAAIAAAAQAGDAAAQASFARWCDRLARALAGVINLLDPDVIVLGGGVSRIDALYREVPKLWGAHVFSDRVDTPLRPALHGDASGVRGAAWLATAD